MIVSIIMPFLQKTHKDIFGQINMIYFDRSKLMMILFWTDVIITLKYEISLDKTQAHNPSKLYLCKPF